MTLRTCNGGECERKNDCRRFRERRDYPHGERFLTAPYHYIRTIGTDGRPMQATHQVCDEFEQWKAPA